MASIYTDKHGPVVQFVGPDGKRRKLRLTDLIRDKKTKSIRDGKKAELEIASFVSKLEQLITAVTYGKPVVGELAAWLESLGATQTKLSAKFIEYGLLAPPAEAENKVTTLGPFLDSYKNLRGDVKGSTAIVYSHTIRNLKSIFGEGRPLASITAGDADEFRLRLLAPKPNGEGLADNTARRRCTLTSQFFRAAVRKGLVSANPFEGIGGSVKGNKSREYFLLRTDAAKILEACPSNRWRLIFALSRFGGLRTPSEHNALRWDGVDLPGGRMLVHSPKTEHHTGGESRWVPIFPELRPFLEQAWDEAEPGEVFVVRRQGDKINLRTQFEKIIKRAGLKPWPKLFQNLRSTRQTELAAVYPIHVVCAWLGNKAAIAAEHYLQVTDADFAKASAPETTGAFLAQSGGVRTVQDGSDASGELALTHVEPQGTFQAHNPSSIKWATQDSNL